MEFKPVVKYAAIVLAVAALLGVEYATYRFGFSSGYVEGVNSGEVSASVNVMAVDNLRHFMQVSTADDAALLETVRNRESSLAWINDASVRKEAEWTLAQTLVTRGLTIEAHDMLQQLLPTVEECDEVWLRRALLVARALADEKHYKEAEVYYAYVTSVYKRDKKQAELVSLLSERVALLPAYVTNTTALQEGTDRLCQTSCSLGAER